MAGGKLTPRQKMINMMYLVLTALLALNITKEVINAFVTINDSIELSKGNIEKQNKNTYDAFAQAMSVDAAKYTAVNTKATNIKTAAANLVKEIQTIKEKLIIETDQIDKGEKTPELRDMERKDDYDVPTTVMVGSEQDGKGKEASRLKALLEGLKKTIVANAPDGSQQDYQKSLEVLLSTKDPDSKSEAYISEGKRTWEMFNFYHNPVVATEALLTKYQSDIRNAESQVIVELFNSVGKFDFRPDRLTPKVIPNSTVVTNGSNYEADILLAATSSTLAPDVFISATYDTVTKTCKGCDIEPIKTVDGYAHWTQASTGEGERKWGGVIRVKKGDGSMDYYPFQSSYVAQKPTSVVAAEKMNVLYIGVDNPMAISVPGVSNDKVKVSIEGGGGAMKPNTSPTGGSGHYISTVTTQGKCNIKVSAEVGGKVTPMGSFEYRVKKVPDPIATVGGTLENGPINKNLLGASNLIPVLKNFDFELYFKITGFKMSLSGKGIEYTEFETVGNQLDERMRATIAKARPGTKVFFEFIKAKMATGTDQSTRSLPPMSFTIQ